MKKQISLDGIVNQTQLLQFDETSVYIGRGDEEIMISFEDVLSLSKTSTKLNNRYFWELILFVKKTNKSITVQFRPNNTLWNKNFPQFHALLNKCNPKAVKTSYRWW